jgi:anhydro-N-acetylmuramic acid kinase
MRVAGIMSGTSLDGVDVAIVDIPGKDKPGKSLKAPIKLVAFASIPYSPRVRARILAVSNAECHTSAISILNFELGELYAKAVLETCRRRKVARESIELIGCHGQTIHHQGGGVTPCTLQIGEASVIAERLGIPVVSDFRTRDIAAGGQGAPLVPFVDYLLFRSATRSRIVLNIGGIANITVLPRSARPEDVIAFDTGPGNMVIDQLVALATHNRQSFDKDGAIAADSHMNRLLLDRILKDPWYSAAPPKTTGREQYGDSFIRRLLATELPVNDLIATATVLTAATIAIGIERFAPGGHEVIASGGGVHNRQLMAQIEAFLPGFRVTTTAEYGLDPDAKEALAFAVLACRTWHRQTGNLPSATGARRAVLLGKVTYGTK